MCAGRTFSVAVFLGWFSGKLTTPGLLTWGGKSKPIMEQGLQCLLLPSTVGKWRLRGQRLPVCIMGPWKSVLPLPPSSTCSKGARWPHTDLTCIWSERWSWKWGNHGKSPQLLEFPPTNRQQDANIQPHLRPGGQPWDDWFEFSRVVCWEGGETTNGPQLTGHNLCVQVNETRL